VTALITGQQITVKVKNSLWPIRSRYAFYISEYVYYSGKVVRPPGLRSDEIGITTEKAHFPIRTINISKIVQVNGVETQFVAVQEQPTVITIVGSKGNTYTVTKYSGEITCTCPGYEFRKTCKHLAMVK
jgi:hypothetical protein